MKKFNKICAKADTCKDLSGAYEYYKDYKYLSGAECVKKCPKFLNAGNLCLDSCLNEFYTDDGNDRIC